MKIKVVPTLIAIGICGLIAYGFYTFHQGENRLILSLGSFIFLSLTLIPVIGINFILPRTTVMIKTVSGIFFTVAVVSNVIFSLFHLSLPLYMIINGILILLYLLIGGSIQRAKQ
jgi:hypothetical protein